MATVEVQSPTNVLLENCSKEELNKVQETNRDRDDIKADDEVYQQEKDEISDDHEEMISLEVQSETYMPSKKTATEKPKGTSEEPEVLEIKDHEEEVDQDSKEKEETINDDELVALEVERKLDITEKEQEIETEEEKESKEEHDNKAKKEAAVVPIEDSNETVEIIVENGEEKEEAKNEKIE